MHPGVSALFIYPIKSAAGIAVQELPLDEFGAVHDRRWMLVDANNVGLTQRDYSTLALIHPEVNGDTLVLRREGLPELRIAEPAFDVPEQRAIVWDDGVLVRDAGHIAANWCSEAVGGNVRLVHITSNSPRALHPKYAGSVRPDGRRVALSDGAPLLILSEASIAHLNERLHDKGASPLGVERFRPNVLIAHTVPHDEDTWRTVEIGDVTLGVGSQCQRCVVTTIDQQTGVRAPARDGPESGEPLRTLAKYRRHGTGVMFGMNATHEKPGVIRLGNQVTVVERKVEAALHPML